MRQTKAAKMFKCTVIFQHLYFETVSWQSTRIFFLKKQVILSKKVRKAKFLNTSLLTVLNVALLQHLYISYNTSPLNSTRLQSTMQVHHYGFKFHTVTVKFPQQTQNIPLEKQIQLSFHHSTLTRMQEHMLLQLL